MPISQHGYLYHHTNQNSVALAQEEYTNQKWNRTESRNRPHAYGNVTYDSTGISNQWGNDKL